LAKETETKVVSPTGKASPFVKQAEAPKPGTPAFPGSPAAAAAAQIGAGPRQITGPVFASSFQIEDVYLKGSDIPQGITQTKVKVLAFVQIPGSRSPLVAQIETVYGKSYLPLNKTNIKQIQTLIQQDDLSVIVGHTLHLTVYMVNNPSNNQMSRGLYVTGGE